jgi:hypothetical protein
MSRAHFFIILSAALGLSCASALAARPEQSVSASRQFIVHGPDIQLRGGLCDLAERTKQKALGLLQQRDEWRTPILLNAQYPQANLPELPRARMNVSQTGFGLKLQLDLVVQAGMNTADIERELLRAIYLEIMYRNEPNTPAGSAYVEPPAWLIEGTLGVAPDRDAGAIADSLRTVRDAGSITPLAQFIAQRPELLDSPSRQLHRAYSAAFVTMLLEMPDGRARLTRYVANLPRAANDPVADLLTYFPPLNDAADRVGERWQQTVARLAARERYELLTAAESEARLVQLLRVGIRERGKAPAEYALEEFPQFVRSNARKPALQHLRHNLLTLSARVNPLYQPVLAEYEQIAALLLRGKTKRVAERLARARGIREHLQREMAQIADYMNWFEATQAEAQSGAFAEYMRAAELALERQPRRRDPISVYLDALEAQMQN